MKYDPNNPLSEEDLDKLGEQDFDSFLEYLDGKTEYLKKFTKPLSSYHTKRFASLNAAFQGKTATDEELKIAENLGKQNEQKVIDKMMDKEWKQKKEKVLKNTGVKNVKTNRSQWFD